MIINILIAVLGVLCTAIIWIQYKKSGSKELLNTLPSIWTSLGILGTFIALVLSLRNLDTSKIDIAKLVLSIAPAFETSIIGISMALLSSLAIKIHFAKIDKKEEDSYIDAVGENMAPEILLHRIYKEQQITNDRISSMIEGISEEVIVHVSETIDQRISDIINVHITRMTDTLSRESTLLDNISQSILAQTERIGSTTQDNLNSISQSFSNHLQMLKDDLERNLSIIATDVTASFSNSVRLLESSSNEDITAIREQNTDLLNTFNISKEEWLQTARMSVSDTFHGFRDELATTISQLSTACASLKTSIEEVNSFMSNSVDEIKDISEYTSSIQMNIRSLCDSVRNDYSSIEALTSKIETILSSTSDVLDANYHLQYQLQQLKKANDSKEPKLKNIRLGLRKMKKCPECGTEVPVAAEFCSNCRHRFE